MGKSFTERHWRYTKLTMNYFFIIALCIYGTLVDEVRAKSTYNEIESPLMRTESNSLFERGDGECYVEIRGTAPFCTGRCRSGEYTIQTNVKDGNGCATGQKVKCSNCEGFTGECDCSTKGSDTTDCDKTTGQCKCRNGFEGKKCDKCKKNVTSNGWCTWVTGGCKYIGCNVCKSGYGPKWPDCSVKCSAYISGTAPSCNGKCKNGEYTTQTNVKDGSACWSGQKVKCSNCKGFTG